MNVPKAQFDGEPRATCFDPDMADMSEQQFAASLEVHIDQTQLERPRFELDVPGPMQAETVATSPEQTPLATFDDNSTPAGCDVRTSTELPLDRLSTTDEDWRDQVTAKVSNYKSRKPRKERYPSLQLQFEGGAYRATGRQSAPSPTPAFSQSVEEDSSSLISQPHVTFEATARVIEFPRPVSPPGRLNELAEPVVDRPRIVEAPELLPPPPALGGMLIESASDTEPARLAGFDMPLLSAPLLRRVLAAMVDLLFVTAAQGIFGYVLFRINGPIQTLRLLGEIAAVLLAVLWPAYQYAFLVFSGTTPGLRVAGLSLSRFDGTPVSRKLRRWRVLASLLSCLSLGLGYFWCFLDEDQLCWHDRITRTHLASPVCGNSGND